MNIELYSPQQKAAWDNFIRTSKNGTFLHCRDYMDYHSDRFTDHSLMIYDDNQQLIAVLPANKQDKTIYSHAGLTYGGIISGRTLYTVKMLEIFAALIEFLQKIQIEKMIYKTIPSIYHVLPAEEDRYALFLCQAELIRRDLLSVIYHAERLPFQERRRRMIAKAQKTGCVVSQSDDYASFWEILHTNLQVKYGVAPVHSLAEILSLRKNFPDNIKLFLCLQSGNVLAGVLIYETETTAHAQYISASDEGKKIGALDLIFHELINQFYPNKRFFDFGISNEDSGKILNKGLIDQKEGFGARGIPHDYYKIQINDSALHHLRNALA